MKNKSVLEQALLEAQQLEEAVKSNAKEILASTMKQEIEDLVKESLNEQEGELDFGEVEQEDLEDEVSGLPNEEEAMVSIEVDADEPLDLTGASDSEVLKVFKAMGAEDGIVVTQDDDVVELEDQEAGTEYKIELAENKLKNYPFINERMGDLNEEEIMDDLEDEEIQPESESALEEALYEIELEEEADWGGKKGNDSDSKRDYETNEMWGGKKGNRSKSRPDYETNEMWGGKKGNRSKSRPDYEDEDLSEQFTDNNSMYNSLQDYQNWCKKEGSEGCDENNYKWNAYLAYRQMGPPASTELEPFIKNLIGGDLVAFEAAYDGDGENPLENVASEEQEIEETSRLKSGQLTFPKMAGQKWGKNDLRESIKTKRTINEIVKISKQLQTENRKYKEKNKDYREALKVFRGKLNEVAVFNANLAYSTKLFTDFTTTKKEKINILRRFDNVSTLNESKSLFKQIAGNLNSEVKSLKESVQKTITKTPSGGSSINLIETKTYENPQITRMKDIMSKL